MNCLNCKHKEICKMYDSFNNVYLKSFSWNINKEDFGTELFTLVSKRCISYEPK